MSMLIDLEEAKTQLYEDEDDQDEYIESLIEAGSAEAEEYCRRTWDDGAPAPVKLAVKLYVAHYYECRDAYSQTEEKAFDITFRRMLYPYRDEQMML